MSAKIEIYEPTMKQWDNISEHSQEILVKYLDTKKKRFYKKYLNGNWDVDICEYLYCDFHNVLEQDEKLIKLFNNCFN